MKESDVAPSQAPATIGQSIRGGEQHGNNALTKAARRLLAHAQLHKAIAAKHQVMAKAFGDLANRCADKDVSECAAIDYAIKSAVSR